MAGIVCGSAFLALVALSFVLAHFAVKPYERLYAKERSFLTDASHELKTPLAIIRTNAEAGLLENPESPYLQSVRKQEGRLSSLVEELILLNRLGEGKDVAPNDLSLSELVGEALECYGPLFDKRGIEVREDVEPGITVKREERLLSRLLGIFFDNAAKYALPSGPFAVSLKRTKKGAILTLENESRPFTQEEAEALFERFETGESSRAADKSGFGIGLSLAKEIASRSGDQVAVKALPPNRIRFEIIFN